MYLHMLLQTYKPTYVRMYVRIRTQTCMRPYIRTYTVLCQAKATPLGKVGNSSICLVTRPKRWLCTCMLAGLPIKRKCKTVAEARGWLHEMWCLWS